MKLLNNPWFKIIIAVIQLTVLKKKSETLFFTTEAKRKKIEEMTKKERKVMRKMQKTNYDLAMKTKQIWEEVRR